MQSVCRAAAFALARLGRIRAASRAMMATTARSSIRVNAEGMKRFARVRFTATPPEREKNGFLPGKMRTTLLPRHPLPHERTRLDSTDRAHRPPRRFDKIDLGRRANGAGSKI